MEGGTELGVSLRILGDINSLTSGLMFEIDIAIIKLYDEMGHSKRSFFAAKMGMVHPFVSILIFIFIFIPGTQC